MGEGAGEDRQTDAAHLAGACDASAVAYGCPGSAVYAKLEERPMTPKERAALAKSILDNPLTDEILNAMEREAVDRCVMAPMTDHDMRAAAAAEVRAIRAFRHTLRASLQDTSPRKAAPV
jgi:hypothetical protein